MHEVIHYLGREHGLRPGVDGVAVISRQVKTMKANQQNPMGFVRVNRVEQHAVPARDGLRQLLDYSQAHDEVNRLAFIGNDYGLFLVKGVHRGKTAMR